ncbi:MAG: MFS transporter [Myxococcota bacterium]
MTNQPRHLRPGSIGVVGVLLTIAFLDELFDGFWGAAWPLVRDDLALTYSQIGLLISIPILLSTLLEPPLGVLADTGWRRHAMLGGGLAYTVALLLLASAPSMWVLLVGEDRR